MNLHEFYYHHVPKWAKRYSPPFGSYNWAFYFVRPHRYIIDLWDETRWFIQRGARGYSDRDVWEWSDYMAKVNVAALRRLADNKMGHPIGMTMNGWRNRLLKMADGFQSIADEENDLTSYKRLNRKEYLALMKSRQKRLKDGLKLYSEYFQNLWD